MFGKVVLLLALSAVAVQSYVPYDVKEQTDAEGDRLIHDLKELIEQASKTAKGSLNNLHIYLVTRYSQTEAEFQSKIFTQLREILADITKLQQEARELKVDTKECMNDDEMIYVVKFHRAIEACTGELVNKPKVLEEKVKKVQEESVKTVDKLAADIQACGEDAKCRNKVVVEVARAMAELPAKIREVADEAVPAVLSSYPAAEKCVLEATDVFIPEERVIATALGACLRRKIHPPKED